MKKLNRQQKIEKLNQISKPVNKNSKWREIAETNKKHQDILEDLMTIALRIRSRLKEMGIRQKELAEKLDVTPQALTRIMQGSQNLTLSKIRQIENILDISLISIRQPSMSQANMRTRLIPVSVAYNLTVSPEKLVKKKTIKKLQESGGDGILESLKVAS